MYERRAPGQEREANRNKKMKVDESPGTRSEQESTEYLSNPHPLGDETS
jgi:hypothetical protein